MREETPESLACRSNSKQANKSFRGDNFKTKPAHPTGFLQYQGDRKDAGKFGLPQRSSGGDRIRPWDLEVMSLASPDLLKPLFCLVVSICLPRCGLASLTKYYRVLASFSTSCKAKERSRGDVPRVGGPRVGVPRVGVPRVGVPRVGQNHQVQVYGIWAVTALREYQKPDPRGHGPDC